MAENFLFISGTQEGSRTLYRMNITTFCVEVVCVLPERFPGGLTMGRLTTIGYYFGDISSTISIKQLNLSNCEATTLITLPDITPNFNVDFDNVLSVSFGYNNSNRVFKLVDSTVSGMSSSNNTSLQQDGDMTVTFPSLSSSTMSSIGKLH